jgi:putative DNA primase/helicase
LNYLTPEHPLPIEYMVTKNGWYNDDSILVTGEIIHSNKQKTEIVQLTEDLKNKYAVKGSKKEWCAGLEKILNYDLTRIKMYATVSSFLLKFLNVKTFILDNWNESTGAKTITMQVSASLVGIPTTGGLIQDAKNTEVGIEKYLEYNTNTPVYYDETSNNPDFKKYIYMMANGKGKGRGNKELSYEEGGNWSTVIQTTGEMALTCDEATLTGLKMRVIELHDAIPIMDQDEIDKIKDTLCNNYGLFLEEIVQKIMEYKPKIKNLYKQIGKFFEKTQNVFSERMKAYFITLAVSGYILEEVFKNNGIQTKEAIDICTKYYKKIILDDPIVPYSEIALNALYQWTTRNLSKFERATKDFGTAGLAKGAVEVCGWITEKAIYYDETMAKLALEKMGYIYSKAHEDWKNGTIDPYMKNGKIQSYVNQTTINGKRITGMKILIDTLKTKLNMDAQILNSGCEDPQDEETNEIEQFKVFLHENPIYKMIDKTPEQAARAYIKEKDKPYLLNGLQHIIELMTICKNGCILN